MGALMTLLKPPLLLVPKEPHTSPSICPGDTTNVAGELDRVGTRCRDVPGGPETHHASRLNRRP